MRERQLAVLVRGVVALGGSTVIASVLALLLRSAPLDVGLGVLAFVLAAAASGVAVLKVRVGSHAAAYTWHESAYVLGLALVPAVEHVLLTGLVVGATNLAKRRGPVKAAYNASVFMLAVVAARTLGAVLEFPGSVLTVHGAAVALVTAMVFLAVTHVGASAAIALAAHRAFLDELVDGLGVMLLVACGKVAAGLMLLALVRWSPFSLTLLPPLVLGLQAILRDRMRSEREAEVWQRLSNATGRVPRLAEDDVLASAAERAMDLFSSAGAEVVVHVGTPADRHVGQRTDHVVSEELPGASGSRVGVLSLFFERPVELDQRELQALSLFTRWLSSTLLNARLYTEAVREGQRQAFEASHDGLTGLANRAHLLDRGRELVTRRRDDEHGSALLLLDLDHFRQVNDTLGHEAGDVLLCEVASRVRGAVRVGDLVARLGGDEFAVLVPDLAGPYGAVGTAQSLLEALSEPVVVDGLRLSIEGSVGIAYHPDDASTMTDLLRCAEVAMYQAKGSPNQVVRYQADRDLASVDHMELVAELRGALDADDQILLHLQPKYDLTDARLVGAEALVRWQHPTSGLLMPGAWVPAVEQSGLIRELTLRVLDLALAELAGWPEHLTVAVNLSARSLLDQRLPGDVAAALEDHGVVARRLTLEITETSAMSELETVEEVLADLRALGVKLSIDDFGTGYSSLQTLKRITVDEVKVDRAFVSSMLSSRGDAAIVQTIVDLAHGFGVTAVAEGIESDAQRAALLALGCDVGQGYHLGRPVVPDVMRALIAESPAPPAAAARARVTRLPTARFPEVAGGD